MDYYVVRGEPHIGARAGMQKVNLRDTSGAYEVVRKGFLYGYYYAFGKEFEY